LNLLENICCAEFLLSYEDEALCIRFDAAQTQKCVSTFQWEQASKETLGDGCAVLTGWQSDQD